MRDDDDGPRVALDECVDLVFGEENCDSRIVETRGDDDDDDKEEEEYEG